MCRKDRYNHEHYPDLTAYEGIKNADKGEDIRRLKKALVDARAVFDKYGFVIVNRIALRDKETKKLYE